MINAANTHIIHLVSNREWGGGEQYVYDIVECIRQESAARVTVVCKDIAALADRFRTIDGINVVTAGLHGYFDVSSIRRIASLLQKDGLHVIHVHNFEMAFVALVARKWSGDRNVRVVMTRHLVSKAKNSLLRNFIYRNIDHIAFVSRLAYDEFFLSHPAIDPAKCSVLHNGVKKRSITRQKDLREEFHLSADCMLLMFHGRIVPEKGVDVLLNALAKLPNRVRWHLFVIGQGADEYVGRLSEHAAHCGIARQVEWLGFQREMLPWIAACDCGVLPSTWREPFGLAVIEYMMMGKPVITTDNGAQKEYIDDGRTGILVPPSDAGALADAIVRLYDDNFGREIGDKAKRHFDEHLSYGIFYQKLLKIYGQ